MFSQILVKDFGPFDKFQWSGHGDINVIVGENDTGKTWLMKMMYAVARSIEEHAKRQESDRPEWQTVLAEKLMWVFQPGGRKLGELVRKGKGPLRVEAMISEEHYHFAFGKDTTSRIAEHTSIERESPSVSAIFIPPKEILTAFDAIAATRENLEIFGFDDTYYDLLKALRLPTTKGRVADNLVRVIHKLEDFCHGNIRRENDEFVFWSGREKFRMSQTAEGFKKIGIFTTLIRNRSLGPGSMLFIDEPELNLHPKGIVELVNMLFDMSNSGIKVYIATHNYFVIAELAILAEQRKISIPFLSLRRENGAVVSELSDMKDGMPQNEIIDESIRLYEREVLAETDSVG